MSGYWHDNVVCLSVCLQVILCIVAKQNILQQKCLNKRIGSGTRLYNCQTPTPTMSPQTPIPKKVRSGIDIVSVLTTAIPETVCRYTVGRSSAVAVIADRTAYDVRYTGKLSHSRLLHDIDSFSSVCFPTKQCKKKQVSERTNRNMLC